MVSDPGDRLSPVAEITRYGMFQNITPAIGIGILTLLLGAYQLRKRGLDTIVDHEEFINSRLAGNMVKNDYWGIEYDRVEITERTGLVYRVKKLLTGRLEGEAEVTVQYRNASLPGELWDADIGAAILNGFPYDVEHIVTDMTLNPTTAVFRIGSVDPDTIKNFSETLLTFEAQHR